MPVHYGIKSAGGRSLVSREQILPGELIDSPMFTGTDARILDRTP